jgi:hypothetical protein
MVDSEYENLRAYEWADDGQVACQVGPEIELLATTSAAGLMAIDSPRRYAAEEYVKPTWKADFTYFPSAENKARFGDYFSISKWIKSSLVKAVIKVFVFLFFDIFACLL